MLNELGEFELGYIVAAIECDGSIYMGKRCGVNGISYRTLVTFSNTSCKLVETVRDMIGSDTRVYIAHFKSPRKDQYRFYIGKLSDVFYLLSQLESYMVLKRRQCELMIEFCELRLKKLTVEHNAPFGKREGEIYEEMRYLNCRKGIHK